MTVFTASTSSKAFYSTLSLTPSSNLPATPVLKKPFCQLSHALSLKAFIYQHCGGCVICCVSKARERTGKVTSVPRSLILYGWVHSDFCGPISTVSIGGSKCYAVFVEDSTRWSEVAILQQRFHLLTCWIEYRWGRANMGYCILPLPFDDGGEFEGLKKYLLSRERYYLAAFPSLYSIRK